MGKKKTRARHSRSRKSVASSKKKAIDKSVSCAEGTAHILGVKCRQLLNKFAESRICIGVVLPLLSIVVGALVTWGVSTWYYKLAAQDLRWEAKAGNIPFDEQELLVAYYKWGQELKPGQAIKLRATEGTTELLYSAEYVGLYFNKRGIATVYSKSGKQKVVIPWVSRPFDTLFFGGGIDFYRTAISEPNGREYWSQGLDIDVNNIVISLNAEGEGLARYLQENRSFVLRVVELWETTGDLDFEMAVEKEHLVKRIWPK